MELIGIFFFFILTAGVVSFTEKLRQREYKSQGAK